MHLGTAPLGTAQREALREAVPSRRQWLLLGAIGVGLVVLVGLVVRLMR